MFSKMFRNLSLAGPVTALLLVQSALVHAAEPRKLAFVAGVSKYQKDGLTNLKYAELDARDLGLKLKEIGFEVSTLLGDRATHAALDSELQKFFGSLKTLNKDDVVLLAFSGHGLQLQIEEPKRGLVETPFFCPVDALKTDAKTLLSLNWVMQRINEDSASSQNLLIVDACRDNPAKGAKGVDGSTVTALPSKLSVLFGSSSGTQSFESDNEHHGIFTWALLEGLKGGAANKNGDITWLNLASFAMDSVKEQAKKSLGVEQRPNILGNLIAQPVLTRIRPTATLPATIGPNVAKEPEIGKPYLSKSGQRLAYIPAGEFEMGNDDTTDNIMRDFPNSQRWWFEVSDRKHKVHITKPFYLGIYPVTRGEFARFVNQAAYTTEAERDKIGGLGIPVDGNIFACKTEYNWKNPGFRQEDNHPVVNVTWNDAMAYIAWLSEQDGRKYRLPTEAEWEYACRAGTKTHYHNGNDPERLKDVANVADASLKKIYSTWWTIAADDGFPYTSPVGHYQKNNFGLKERKGNVRNGGNDWFDKDYYGKWPANDPPGPAFGNEHNDKVLRGGSWTYIAVLCRSAHRNYYPPSYRFSFAGFRIALDR